MNAILFYFLAGVILLPAIAVVFSRNLFHAGLSLIVSFLGIAAIYAMLSAPFVAGIQVLVYAGAIAVLLLFAFMLTHDIMKPMESPTRVQQGSAAAVCLLLSAAMARILVSADWNIPAPASTEGVALTDLGLAYLTRYLVPFELISILLLITLIGAVVIARKEERDPPTVLFESAKFDDPQAPDDVATTSEGEATP